MSVMKTLTMYYHRLGSPRFFYGYATRWLPWIAGIAVLLLVAGWGLGLLVAPEDYQQGNSYRIIFIHVPASIAALSGFMAMGVCGLFILVWRMKMAEILLKAIAPFGTLLAALSLITGALWGKPTWGTYWVWDARLTSMLVLLFLYIAVQALHNAVRDPRQAARAAGLLSLVGVINVVIVKYSVDWWFSLHQGSTLKIIGETTMPWSMLTPLLLSLFGMYFLYAAIVLVRAKTEIVWRERRSNWVRQMLSGRNHHGV